MFFGIDKQIYEIEPQTFLYDAEYNPIKLEEQATMQAKWDGNYYLKTQQKESYNLGKYVVAYQSIYNQLDLYGKIYQIGSDGEVTKLTGNNKITDFAQDNIYKLADRQYLITSNRIANDTGKLNTSKYIIIIIDKAGNTLLLNHEVNSKTIKPMIIQTPSFTFDIANEKLIYGDREIDLKKIIGSTNEYQEKEDVQNSTEVAIEGKGTNASTETQVQTQPNVQNSQSTQINNNNRQITSINGGASSDTESTDKVSLSKSVTLLGITTTSSSLTVKYDIQDPESKYQVVYLEIDGDISKTIALDKSNTSYTVSGLTPNTNYKVTLASKELDDDGATIQNIDDIMIARTNKVNTNLTITKVTTNKIYYNLKLDSNYVFDQAQLSLYVDGVKQKTVDVNITSAVGQSGLSGNFDYIYGNEVILKLENVKYNGKAINIDTSAKFKNY